MKEGASGAERKPESADLKVLSTWQRIADNISMNIFPNYRGYRFPLEIISHAAWLCHRFTLNLRDIEDLLAERNVI